MRQPSHLANPSPPPRTLWPFLLLLMLVAVCPWGPAAYAAEAFLESSGKVVMEAEHYDKAVTRNGKAWTLEVATAGFSGTGYLRALPNTDVNTNTGYTTSSPELIYNVQFATPGTYYVWIRGYGATTSDDSVHAGIDGAGPTSADRIGSFPATWTWRRDTLDATAASVVVAAAGLHTIHVWMREDGFRVDKLLLRTSSSSTAPSGLGPAESPRSAPADATPPTGSVLINGVAAATNNATVTLTISASDNSGTVAQMQFSNDGTTYSAPEPYSTAKSWTLSSGDGAKTVSARFADAGGNWSAPVSDSITLDTTPPTIANVQALNISATGASLSWTTNEATSGLVEYGTTPAYGASASSPDSQAMSHSVSLTGLSPLTTYYYRVQATDAVGWTQVSAGASFTTASPPDADPPTGTVTINGGAAATNSSTVTLTLSATDNSGTVAQMRFSNDGTSYSTAEPYGTTKSWTLPSGDGTKTVYARFADAAGNWSVPASDAIALDTVAPVIQFTSPADGAVLVVPVQ